MAQRRMFSKKITDTDKFIDMPLSSQALYFHLNISADDEGFIDRAKTVQRTIGASDDDMKILIAKGFIIPFESGVVVIRHWRIHNYIQSDRFQATLYQKEKAQLEFDKTKTASLKAFDKCIQNVSKTETQDRLDKTKLDKTKLDKMSADEYKEPVSQLKEISDYFQHEIGVLTPNQFEQLSDYLTEDTFDVDVIKRAIDKAANSAKRSFGYVNGILRGWRQNGITTIAQVEDEQRQFVDTKAKERSKTNIPEWSNPDYKAPKLEDLMLPEEELDAEPF